VFTLYYDARTSESQIRNTGVRITAEALQSSVTNSTCY